MARICEITVPPEENAQHFTHYAQEISVRVWRLDTELGIKSPKPGMVTFSSGSSYLMMLNSMQIVDKVIEAEREGYDAAVIHGFIDPGLRLARTAVSIPVIGPAESSMLTACMYGAKFGVVTISTPGAATYMENMVREYGLEDRAVHKPVRPISIPKSSIWPELNLDSRPIKGDKISCLQHVGTIGNTVDLRNIKKNKEIKKNEHRTLNIQR